MIKHVFSIILLTFSVTVFTQNFELKGIVKDSLGSPLLYANVIAKPRDVTKNMSFSVTDEKGRYRLELKTNVNYTIDVSYIGYKKASFVILSNKNIQKNIILKEAKNKLEEVVIELPVTVKGDTTIYNTQKFINGKERKLKNILKKLPGVQINKNGVVTVKGKKVTKMLVDGKPFFGGNTKLAIENIPADVVAKVEAIDNYNEVAFLRGLTDSNKLAMNIKLKEGKKRFVFGDVEVGKGNEEYYKSNANLFYYAPKTNVNFISSSNNIAKKAFTFKDYMSFQGGSNAVFNNGFDWKGGDLSQFIENTDVLKSKEHFGALNISNVVSSKLDLSGFVIFSHTNTSSRIVNKNEYAGFQELQNISTKAINTLGIGKFTFDYTPNNKEQWFFKTQFKNSDNNKDNGISSIVNAIDNRIEVEKKSGISNFNQNVEWHKKGNRKHTYSATANFLFDNNILNSSWNTNQPILNGIVPVSNNLRELNINQLRKTKQYNFTTIFKDFWVLNRNNHIYTTIGNTYQKHQFFTDDFQLLTNGVTNNFSANNFGNDTQYSFHDLFLGAHYKFKIGIFTFKQGVYLHKYNWSVVQEHIIKRSKWNLLPDFLMKIDFNKSKGITARYNLKTTFMDVSKLANRFYLQSYNSVFKGNENLENELYHSVNLNYHRFSFYKGLFFNANINYTKKVKGYTTRVAFLDNLNASKTVDRFLTQDLLLNPSENWNAAVFFEKRIKKIRYKLSGDYINSNYIQDINNVIVKNESNNYSFDIGLETLFDKLPLINIGFRKSIGTYKSSNITSKFSANEPYVDIDYDFLNAFKLTFDYSYYDYKNQTESQSNRYSITNASIFYQKEDSPWNFKITAQNLTDETFKQSNSFSDYLISDTRTYIMPRIILFGIGYKL
ncbi:CarboxypepD_reg-like domain-containing protein [Tenacibaculum sp. MAR_2010_89]|uniref:carboxypeptidase-like regulatory domain-containing protein n=1 Tax=Tenacibaculum sp. MAR_2010_89 TaxID=1250198 RepID=UPI00089C6989|nr:carboxypeptidase-like regulatory domain-containing protein [Tenacibaculum sp. MAR_2010_89]SEE06589.1 CarboxypepD_reg-like domain-containing protein [Tenacibaculum sp. MAR_2010_89]